MAKWLQHIKTKYQVRARGRVVAGVPTKVFYILNEFRAFIDYL